MKSGLDVLKTEEFATFWPGGWIFARLTVDVRSAVQDCQKFGWEAGARLLRPLAQEGVLRIFDVSCGLGLSSIAAARAGHNVTATEVSSEVLQIVGQNAQRNAAQLRLWRWDLQMEPPPGLVKPLEGPSDSAYHLCLLDLGWLNMRDRAANLLKDWRISIVLGEEWPILESVLNSTLVRLRQLGGCKLHAFIGRTTAGDAVVLEHAAVELESSTKELLRALDTLGAEFPTSAGPREATVSPLGWLEKIGWTPPIWHHLILW
ncbi:unnamed protein product [Symbiodinium natans]|uniref:Methyltransferase domain-containing protein n=1 Tax=Symbiodinium natans TaxID=878477 RepID=A0A812I9W6_9DINO|nr:unnamed protein product [Symbiodinium natans]